MSLPIILGADTIQVGMYITVLAHKPITHERLGNIFGMFDPADSWRAMEAEQTLLPFKIVAIRAMF